MGVVGDAGGHRTPLEAVSLQVTHTDMMGILVPLHHGDLQNVPFRINVVGIALVHSDNLAGDHADDPSRPPLGEILGGQVGQVEGIVGLLDQIWVDLRSGKVSDRPAVVHLLPPLEHLEDVEVLEIVDNHKIRQISRSDGPPVVQQEVPRRVVAGHLHRQNGVHPPTDSPAHNVVDVPLLQQVAGVLVVTAEHTPLGVLLRQKGQQSLQVPGSGALPDHDELSTLQFGDGIGGVVALVVGIDSGGDVRV